MRKLHTNVSMAGLKVKSSKDRPSYNLRALLPCTELQISNYGCILGQEGNSRHKRHSYNIHSHARVSDYNPKVLHWNKTPISYYGCVPSKKKNRAIKDTQNNTCTRAFLILTRMSYLGINYRYSIMHVFQGKKRKFALSKTFTIEQHLHSCFPIKPEYFTCEINYRYPIMGILHIIEKLAPSKALPRTRF